jgi:tRNA threonylcarbamoyladenosine biosynthesis protein TsaE
VAPVSATARTVSMLTRSARQTHALGVSLGKLLAPGDVVALVGDLGAGKTQLVRGACAGAGVRPQDVSSPSFAIVATYAGRLPVHHADLYRIADEEELYGTGFGDLPGGEGALLVEWADRIPSALPGEKLTIRLAHDARRPDVRHVELEGVGERHAGLAELVARAGSPRGRRRGRGRGRGRGREGDVSNQTKSRSKSKTKSKMKPTTTTTTSTSTKKRARTTRP